MNGPTIAQNSGIGALTGDITGGGIGVLHGDQYVNQYVVDPAAAPEEIFREGMRCLAAGMRGRAQELTGRAVQRGHQTREAYYGWALTIVSRRSPENLTDEDWQTLRGALDGVAAARPGEPATDQAGYLAAARLVDELMRAAIVEDGTADPAAGATFARRVAALAVPRRAEVTDHLRYVLQRVEESTLSAAESAEIDAALVAERRRDRAERAPLFFTPDPLPLREPPPAGDSVWPDDQATVNWLLGVAGLLLVLGLVLALVNLGSIQVPVLVVMLLGLLPGAVLLVQNGEGELRRRARQARRPGWVREGRPVSPAEQARQPAGPAGPARIPEVLAFHAFRSRLLALSAARFARARPPAGPDPAGWQHATAHLQFEVADELACRYGQSGPAEGLDWLLQVRAELAARQWAAGTLRPPGRSSYQLWQGTRVGLALSGAGLLIPAYLLLTLVPTMGAVVLTLWVTAVVLGLGGWNRGVALRLAAEEAAAFVEERRWHAEWSAFLLARRPADEEMGRWLDLDQRSLLRDMLREHRMERRAVLFNFFVLEPAAGCLRAKVPNGPPRYSRYGVRLFVLTTAGVWVCNWELDFDTARHDGRRDFVFRFDSISSVLLQTVGDRAGAVGWPAADARRGAGEVLRLVLNNREDLEVAIETHEQLTNSPATLGQLRELALETSGVAAGFRVLAALATEGEGWFDQRRAESRLAFLDGADAGERKGPPAPR
ncbi:hypothetical protein RM844_28270 [Streptomyces sp. DSM 44915]|uniref:Uncharacterized protein n=1 Tax=Streptomyces chisholmiae TaxID=3075540 RepID=A0ABU2K146_9ACTN|nr:hypothetical protein [Streptomyces sp. DSM 44915]MDT0270173.1 hypothetical protein [Streptomyces sp. DSM 44915]